MAQIKIQGDYDERRPWILLAYMKGISDMFARAAGPKASESAASRLENGTEKTE